MYICSEVNPTDVNGANSEGIENLTDDLEDCLTPSPTTLADWTALMIDERSGSE